MTHTDAHPLRRGMKRVIDPVFNIATLARWQIRQVWKIFILVALGMIAAVLLVGTVPLLTRVNLTANARSAFTAGSSSFNTTSHVEFIPLNSLDASQLQQAIQQLQHDYKREGSPFFDLPPRAVLHLNGLDVYASDGVTQLSTQFLSIHGYNIGQVASRLHLLQGRFPQTSSAGLEVALTRDNATAMGAHLGSTYTIYLSLTDTSVNPSKTTMVPITLKVVGILQNLAPADEVGPFWHGDALDWQPPARSPAEDSMLVANDALFTRLSQLAHQHPGQTIFSGGGVQVSMDVFMPLDVQSITDTNINKLPSVLAELASTEPMQVDYVTTDPVTIDNGSLLFLYQQIGSQTMVGQIPTLTILTLMFGLLLLFVAFMVELLVTRQAEAIAVMRSRGATLQQVFLAFVSQSLLLGLLTIVASALFVPMLIRALVLTFLPPVSQQALNILPITPWAILNALGWYPWLAATLATLTMIVVAWRALRGSMLERGSQRTVSAQRPLWQRLYADVILALLGLLTAGLYTYLGSLNVLDAQTQFVLAGPCMLVTATLFCLAGGLFFLRIFPLLMRLGARLTRSRRGLIPYFPMIIMARAPRHAIRSALLLTFTLIFALFAQIFFATQQQHLVDLANYLAPADISGFLLNAQNGSQVQSPFAQLEVQYQHIPGVQSAALAFSDEWIITDQNSADPASTSSLTLIATDPSSFERAINWPTLDNQKNVQTILARLTDQRPAILRANADVNTTPSAVPAMVSAATAKLLHLKVGTTFSLRATDFGISMTFVDAGEISYLPGVNNVGADHGFLVDYTSFAADFATIAPYATLNTTNVWFHIQPGAASRVLPALTGGPLALSNIIVHQTVLNQLRNDPLTLNLLCLLTLGIGLALLLAWVGCLVSAWLSVRARLRGLLVLRALGTAPHQLGWLLAWEQTIIFTTAFLLSLAGGAGFTALALPNTVLSSAMQVSATANIFQIQFIPLIPVLPATLWLSLGVLVLLCAATIALTGLWIARLSPAQMLRLSEDYVEEASLREPQTEPATGQKIRQTRLSLWGEANLARSLTPVRHSWGILSLAQIGIVFAVLFACVVPLFSQVAATAGLQTLLDQPTNQYVTVTNTTTDAIPLGKVQRALNQATSTLDQAITTQAEIYIQPEPIVSVQAGQVAFLVTSPDAPTYHSHLLLTLNFAGLSARNLSGQITLLQGRLPEPSRTLQILLTPQAAAALHLKIGDTITQAEGYPIAMRLVGLFQPHAGASPFLPGSFFFAGKPKQQVAPGVTVLTTTEALGPALDAVKAPQAPTYYGSFSAAITWSYPLTRAINSTQLAGLIASLSTLHESSAHAQPGSFTLSPFTTPVAAFQQYQQSVEVSTIPILCVSALIIALLLLFLSFMVDLLVEREAHTIATLRSRGATRWQIYTAFLKRTVVMSGLGLIGGLVLAVPVVFVLTHLTLLPADQQAGLRLLTYQPGQSLLTLLLWALLGTLVTLVATALTLMQAAHTDFLSLRRETARAIRKSYWQRWYLDIIVLVMALTAYAYTLYLSNSNVFDSQITVQVKAPLALATTLCLVLGSMLFLLRLFPLLLRLGARQAGRGQGVERMLALAQMARAPRQRLRTALLLLLTTAFVLFVLVFAASQNQHLSEVAQYWAGADFSGTPLNNFTTTQVRTYTRLPGVTSVAVGHMDTQSLGDGSVSIVAVDPSSFMRTVPWPGMSVGQQRTLIAELTDPWRFPDLEQGMEDALYTRGATTIVPAIIDAQTAQALQVTRGKVFTLNEQNYLVVAIVSAIPTVNDAPPTTSVTYAGGMSGMLISYQLANEIYLGRYKQNLSLDYIWLQTDGSTQSLQRIRHALTTGPLRLQAFYDRQATIQALSNDPLERDLSGILALGTFVPLLLAWIACLLASWIDVRQRQLLMGVLRALGTTPRQLAKVLAWEQGLIFGSAIVLGTLFGLLTAFLALPSLVLTSVLPELSSSAGNIANGVQDLFSIQGLPPAHVVLPPTLLAVIALLGLLGVLSVFLMIRSAARLSLGQMLRLNED